MNYFSRLTDIVTCNLSEILANEDDPQAAVEQIISEMKEGLNGAKRSVTTAKASEERIQGELDEHNQQTGYWSGRAKEELTAGNEDGARTAILRKQEVEDVIAGLEQQREAAVATREHLTTTLRALEARLADAGRKMQQLNSGASGDPTRISNGLSPADADALGDERAKQVEAELEALKRELGQD